LPRSKYLSMRTLPIIKYDSLPITWIVWGSFLFLLGFLKQVLVLLFNR
jgi:hypothetical protein